MRFPSREIGVVLLLASGGLIASGCGDGVAATPEHVIHVSERDFVIHAPATVAPGPARIVVANDGPDRHELILVRLPKHGIPLRSDGVTLDEDALESMTLGAVEAGDPGQRQQFDVRLRPGRYLLFCNTDGHFMGGMRAVLVVRSSA